MDQGKRLSVLAGFSVVSTAKKKNSLITLLSDLVHVLLWQAALSGV